MKRQIDVLVTMPPHAPFIGDVLEHGRVSGIRFNTVMPIKGSIEENLKRLNEEASSRRKELWVDLKCRQLRVKEFGEPPYTDVKLSHKIDVYTPTKAYFSDRDESATILEVDGDRLILQEGPKKANGEKRIVGPGESITIPHPTLRIHGYLTDLDKKYIEASSKLGFHNYMLSFVEKPEDIEDLLKLDNEARIDEKIESERGLAYVSKNRKVETNGKKRRLMAARGDLYMELQWPHTIIDALEKILEKDGEAIAASRIMSSMSESPEPSSADIGDLDNLLRMGYNTLMLGDEVCLRKETVISALNVIDRMARRYER